MNLIKQKLKSQLTIAYFILLCIEIISESIFINSNNAILLFVTKPLLMPILMLWAFLFSKENSVTPSKILLLALLFSLFGDIFLMLMPFTQSLFIFGLGSFLIAHAFYIILFNKLPHCINTRTSNKNVLMLLACLIFGTLLIGFLYVQKSPAFLSMQIPVIVYACVILTMLLSAFSYYQKSQKSGIWILMGALLFVLSDTTIALSKFSPIFADNTILARTIIMSFYGIAQFMIVKGSLLSTISEQNNNDKTISQNK